MCGLSVLSCGPDKRGDPAADRPRGYVQKSSCRPLGTGVGTQKRARLDPVQTKTETTMRTPKPPDHLSAASKRWWLEVVEGFALEPHHLRLLELAASAWDRCEQAREALATHGAVYTDKLGQPKARPEVAIERDSRIAFARLLRELGLESAPADAPRPPSLRR